MATENKRVVAYLSDAEHDELTNLSDDWGLSLSKTIARLIKEVGTKKTTTGTLPPSGLSEQKVTTLIDSKIDTLISDKIGTLETAITQLRDELKPEPVDIDKLKDAVLNALTEPEKKQ